MKRVENYYYWQTIKDWKDALEYGYVEMKHQDLLPFFLKKSDNFLEKIIDMAEQDCFPISVVCIRDERGCYLAEDGLLRELIDFLDNKIPILNDRGEELFFENMAERRKRNLLRAQIPSIWIEM